MHWKWREKKYIYKKNNIIKSFSEFIAFEPIFLNGIGAEKPLMQGNTASCFYDPLYKGFELYFLWEILENGLILIKIFDFSFQAKLILKNQMKKAFEE